jgi:hypothetical protein
MMAHPIVLFTRNCLLENTTSMSRVWKLLPIAAALVVPILFTSCNSSGDAQVRVINAVPNVPGGSVDVYINTTTGIKLASNLGFGQISPSAGQSATYTNVPGGNDTITSYITGQTSSAINNGSATLSGSTQYTVLLFGSYASNYNPAVFTDTKTAPDTGDLEFRVINGSLSTGSPTSGPGVDVYIYPAGSQQPSSPTFSSLFLGQGQYTQGLVYSSTAGYVLAVTPHGDPFGYYINRVYSPADGSITTLVIVDNNGGLGVSTTPLEYTDLQ